jgi:microfibrillar-associated protein 1
LTIKPVFVPKSHRNTLYSREQQELVAELEREKKRQADEKRKELSRLELADTLKREELTKELLGHDGDSDAGIPEDVSDYDDDYEYEAWKLRELKRLKRDFEERQIVILEKAEILRRRNLTDEERKLEDKLLGKETWEEAREHKEKYKFLQKYYHKGVFYMDNESIRQKDDVRARDYSAPTLEDNIDKEKLPQIMQVKNFGKKGRTKYTHLLDQDTTMKGMNRIDLRPHQQVLQSYLGKRSGVKNSF